MLFFLNGDGTMTRQDNTRIFQGSNNATTITVIAPFGAPSALQIAFQLPNGIWKQSYLMARRGEFMGLNPSGEQMATGVYAYDILLPYSVTEFVGTCGIAIRVVNETTQVVLATYTANFIIEESVLPSPPDGMTPDEFNELYTLLSSYYTQNQAVLQQNEELINTIQGDYNSVILRLDAVEAGIAALQQQTSNPLLGDFTINQQTGEGVKFYKDGTTQSFEVPFAQYISTVNRKDFLTAVTFTTANWSAVGDGTYSLSLTSAQTGRTNSQYLVAIEELVGGEYVQRAYAIDKNADGSIVVSGVTTPFDGRIITIASGGAGTIWHEGTLLTGTGQQTSTDEDLRAVAAVGDFYLNTDNGNVYKCTAVTDTESVWEYVSNLKGVPGDPATNLVQSVNGKTGVVVLAVADINGLETALSGKVDTSELGVPSGVATLDGNGKVPLSQINDSVLGQVEYLGNWNANTGAVDGNDLRSPAGRAYRKGDYYICAVAGSKVPNPSGSGFLTSTITFAVGDWIIFTVGTGADAWEKVDNTDAVTSVNGKTGAVTLSASDVGAEPVFEKNTAFNKNFGTEAGTVCQGNDSRLSDARPANGGNAATVGGKSPSDFATAAQGKKADTAYQKPSTGIPESDLSEDVQTKLNASGGGGGLIHEIVKPDEQGNFMELVSRLTFEDRQVVYACVNEPTADTIDFVLEGDVSLQCIVNGVRYYGSFPIFDLYYIDSDENQTLKQASFIVGDRGSMLLLYDTPVASAQKQVVSATVSPYFWVHIYYTLRSYA